MVSRHNSQDQKLAHIISQKMLPQHQRTVHFAYHDSILEIPHINDMSDWEINDRYLSSSELEAIRNECKICVRIMDANQEQKAICTRGLNEHKFMKTSQMQGIRDDIYDSVFLVQTLQEIFWVKIFRS